MTQEATNSDDDVVVFRPLSIALLTVSDSRDRSTDKSGDFLERALVSAGHLLAARELVKDERQQIREVLESWCADKAIEVAITTGGTGITARDVTPEVARELLDKELAGFGELFRQLSFAKIGASAIQSRATAGVMGGGVMGGGVMGGGVMGGGVMGRGVMSKTLLFVLPGSPGACRDAWTGILEKQLDIRTKPCNFVELLPRL